MANPLRWLARSGLAALGFDPRWLEAASGSAAVLWGGMVLVHGAEGYAAYAPLNPFISDTLLGCLFVAGGAVQLAAVLHDHPLARIPVAAAMASVWLLASYGVLVCAPQSPTFAVLLSLGVWNMLAMLVLIHLSGRLAGSLCRRTR